MSLLTGRIPYFGEVALITTLPGTVSREWQREQQARASPPTRTTVADRNTSVPCNKLLEAMKTGSEVGGFQNVRAEYAHPEIASPSTLQPATPSAGTRVASTAPWTGCGSSTQLWRVEAPEPHQDTRSQLKNLKPSTHLRKWTKTSACCVFMCDRVRLVRDHLSHFKPKRIPGRKIVQTTRAQFRCKIQTVYITRFIA